VGLFGVLNNEPAAIELNETPLIPQCPDNLGNVGVRLIVSGSNDGELADQRFDQARVPELAAPGQRAGLDLIVRSPEVRKQITHLVIGRTRARRPRTIARGEHSARDGES
jgi:hypothetical protein